MPLAGLLWLVFAAMRKGVLNSLQAAVAAFAAYLAGRNPLTATIAH
jgi:hypothetical protein